MTQTNQTIEAILNHANKKLETSKASNIFSQGAVQASKEIATSFVEFIAKRRDEYSSLVQQEKMTVEVANLILSQLRSANVFLEEKHKDYEKINYIKQGELISVNAQVNELQSLLEEARKPASVEISSPGSTLSAESVVSTEENLSQSLQGKQDDTGVTKVLKKRPDELDTKIGAAARDIKNRRKEAQMSVSPAEPKRPGRPKK